MSSGRGYASIPRLSRLLLVRGLFALLNLLSHLFKLSSKLLAGNVHDSTRAFFFLDVHLDRLHQVVHSFVELFVIDFVLQHLRQEPGDFLVLTNRLFNKIRRNVFDRWIEDPFFNVSVRQKLFFDLLEQVFATVGLAFVRGNVFGK